MAELIAARQEDYDALAGYLGAFIGTYGERRFWLSRFRLWWDANPAYAADQPRGWLLKDQGRIAGFLGAVPSRMLVGGGERTVYSITSWMVDEAFRDRSLELLLRLMEHAADTLLFDTTPTDHVDEILRNLEFKPLPWGEDKESFVLIDPARCVEALLPELPGSGLAAKAAAAPLGLLQRLRGAGAGKSGRRVARCAAADAAFDTLWESTRKSAATTNVRTAAVLKWHCTEDDKIDKRLYACREGDKLSAYAIMRVRDRRGLRTLECVDLWPNETPALSDLISQIAEDARIEGLHLLTFPHFSPRLGARLRELNLFERGLRRKNLCLAPAGLRDALREENSYFVGLQGDYGTAGP
ncbi:MAG: hypothetical protein ABIJ96_08585 [Elusimicrobiota bacterium]